MLFLRDTLVILSVLVVGWTRWTLAQDNAILGTFIVPDNGGGSAAVLGQNFTFEWTTTAFQEGTNDMVSLALRRGDPGGEFSRIAMITDGLIQNVGSYTWEVPATLFTDIDYFVVLRSTSGFSTMVSNTFRITLPGSPVIGAKPTAGPGVSTITATAISESTSPTSSLSIISDSGTGPAETIVSAVPEKVRTQDLVPFGVKVVVVIAGAVIVAGVAVLCIFICKRRTKCMIEKERQRLAREKAEVIASESVSSSPSSSPSSEMEGTATLSSLRRPPPTYEEKLTVRSPSTVRHELPVDPVELESTPTSTYRKRISEDSLAWPLPNDPEVFLDETLRDDERRKGRPRSDRGSYM